MAPDALLAHLKLHLTGDSDFPTPYFQTFFEYVNGSSIIEIIMKDRERNLKVLRSVFMNFGNRKMNMSNLVYLNFLMLI